MLKIKKIFFVIIVCLSTISVVAQQDAKSILEELKKRLSEKENYQTDVLYKVFKGYQSEEPHETSSGVFFKKGNNVYSKMAEAEIVSTKDLYLKINHKEKAILVANGSQEIQNADQFNLDELFQYLDVDTLKVNTTSWEIILKAKPITQLPFSSIEIEIDKKTYNIKSQVFYYVSQIDFSKELRKTDLAPAKLEVTYKNYRTNKFTLSDKVFNSKQYVVKKNTKYVAVNKYKGYDIVDVIQPKK